VVVFSTTSNGCLVDLLRTPCSAVAETEEQGVGGRTSELGMNAVNRASLVTPIQGFWVC
jgi:hypothetical protein